MGCHIILYYDQSQGEQVTKNIELEKFGRQNRQK